MLILRTQLNDLLALKQQQASVVQAWQSVKQSEEAVSQGRAIMVFTIVTIFFVSSIYFLPSNIMLLSLPSGLAPFVFHGKYFLV
jgi:hypothetical protein